MLPYPTCTASCPHASTTLSMHIDAVLLFSGTGLPKGGGIREGYRFAFLFSVIL